MEITLGQMSDVDPAEVTRVVVRHEPTAVERALLALLPVVAPDVEVVDRRG